jgi:hypothetical protein
MQPGATWADDGERGSHLALFFLRQLAERRGDDARAVEPPLLADGSSRCARVGGPAYRHGDRRVLALLDDCAARRRGCVEIGGRAEPPRAGGDVDAALKESTASAAYGH